MGFVFKIIRIILILVILAEAPEKRENFWFIDLKVDKIPCWVLFFIFTIEKNKGGAGTELAGFRK